MRTALPQGSQGLPGKFTKCGCKMVRIMPLELQKFGTLLTIISNFYEVIFTNDAQLSCVFAIVVAVHFVRSSSRRFYARNLSSIRSVRSAIPKSERTGRRLPTIARSRRLKPTTSCRKGKLRLGEEYAHSIHNVVYDAVVSGV